MDDLRRLTDLIDDLDMPEGKYLRAMNLCQSIYRTLPEEKQPPPVYCNLEEYIQHYKREDYYHFYYRAFRKVFRPWNEPIRLMLRKMPRKVPIKHMRLQASLNKKLRRKVAEKRLQFVKKVVDDMGADNSLFVEIWSDLGELESD